MMLGPLGRSLPGPREFDAQEEMWVPWSPRANISECVFPHDVDLSGALPAPSFTQGPVHWDGPASNAVSPVVGDIPGEHPHGMFDATAQTSPSETDNHRIISDTPSPSTLSPSTISGHLPSPAGLSASLQVVHYSHTKKPKKREAQRSRVAKPRTKDRKPRGLSSRPDALKTDKAPKTSVRRDVSGKIAGTITIFGLSQVVRAPVSSESQLATSITRKIGACPRCRQHRMRCDIPDNEYMPCARCMKLAMNHQHQPCIRVEILDLRLHRKGPTLYNDLQIWVQGKQKLLESNSQDRHVLFLTQGFGEGLENALPLTVSRFEPGPGDRTAYHWTDSSGRHRTKEMPPYFISDLDAARQSIREFLHNARSAYIDTLLADSNPIVCQTFQTALTYTAFGQSKLISVALDTWVAARFIESHWRIFCGGAMIGLEPDNEPGHPYHDFIPVTPIMDSQLDDLVIRDLITPLTSEFLRRLKNKIDEKKKENWLEIYLAIFIMMSNIGWVLKDMIAMTTWKGLKPGNRGGTLTQGYIHACKTMLAYFHFACNGSAPLSIAFSELGGRDKKKNNMTIDQLEYLRSIQQELSRQEAKLSRWNEISMYEDEIYWCYQLLCKDWRADIPYAIEIDDFREQDFLSSSTT